MEGRVALAIYNDLAYLYALIRNINAIMQEGINLDTEEFKEQMEDFKKQANRGLAALVDDPDRALKGYGAFFGAPEDEG